ncbi:rhomboid family intramembrane serine protease [Bacillus sp. Marseille-P3661]|uniref:rhomboid family intramembrane serine protease n=1 Tax=Bacillus sp. Marseille-P3661 TaxID=1936234 RepID=UPI0035B564CB
MPLTTVLEHDVLYWRIVHKLIISKEYRIIRLDESGETWLESIDRKNGKLLRLIRYDMDWGNWLINDIHQVAKTVSQLKKQSLQKNFIVYNIYLSTYPPVDDWEHRIDSQLTAGIKTYLIDSRNSEEQITALFNDLHFPVPTFPIGLEGQNIFELIRSIQTFDKNQKQQEQKLLFASKPFLTYVFVAINLVMFLLLEWFGSSTDTTTLIRFGAKFNPAIYDGEWWRFITPVFLHIGIFHLFMNTVALYYLGVSVERIYGTWRFFLVYLISGIVGVIASFAFTNQVSAGASGAIFGCFGALLYFGVVHRSLFFRTMGMNVIFVVILNLVIGFAVPMVDNSAHIGGLVAGFLASAFVHLPNHKVIKRQLVGIVFLVLLSGGILHYGYFYADRSVDPIVTAQIAQQLINEGDFEKANDLLSNLVSEQEEVLPEVYFLLSFTEIKLGDLLAAAEHLELVIQGKKDFHEAYYNLALVYAELNEVDKARVAIEKAIVLNPDDQDYQFLYKQLEPDN